MIWIFKINEVFWNNKPKINNYYSFDTDDINFDITNYDISLHFPTADYFIVNESNLKKIYKLEPRFVSIGEGNPFRIPSNNQNIKNLIIEFFQEQRDNKINKIISD
jgi:hypothetical protein